LTHSLKQFLTQDKIIYAGLFFVAVLMFFWPVPRTIAVRNIAFALSLLTFGYIYFKNNKIGISSSKPVKIICAILFAATVWFYLVALFVSNETLWSLKELNGQWLMGVLAFILGIVAASLPTSKSKIVFLIAVSMLCVHLFYIDLFAVKSFVSHNGVFQLRLEGLTEGCDKANYITNWALAIVGAEIYFRAVKHKRLIPIDNFLLFCIFVLILASSYFETMRFGFIGLIFTFVGFLFLYLIANVKIFSIAKLATIFAALVILFSSFLFVSYKADSRWQSVEETFYISLDTKTNKAWLNWDKYPKPVLSNGETVVHSNYVRPAWIKEGAILIAENPFGIGYGRNAFGHALKAKYGEGGGHSHSGIIDLGIGVGIPGMLLWVAFLASLMYYGFKSFKEDDSYFGMVLLFIVSGFFFRMIVDSVIRDHMLEQFMFLAGFLLLLSVKEKNEKNNASEI
jgi:hypothetical protein